MKNEIHVPFSESKESGRDGMQESSGWDSMEDWVEEHPFRPNQESESSGEKNENSDSRLAEIRRKHIGFFEGTYDPTPEEMDEFYSDKEFKKSREYLEYRRRQFERLKEKHTDVFNPSDESVRSTIEPFFESIRSDIDTLLVIGDRLEKRDFNKRDVGALVSFFAEKYGISDVPGLEFVSNDGVSANIGRNSVEEDGCSGEYVVYENMIMLRLGRARLDVPDFIRAIAHEVWHAYQHQHEEDEEKYRINSANYFKSSEDEDAYCSQIIEKEAYMIGDTVDALYRIRAYPEKIPELSQKYIDYRLRRYDPYGDGDGEDILYLKMAHEECPSYMRKYLRDNIDEVIRLNDEYERMQSELSTTKLWTGTDVRILRIAHEEYEWLNSQPEEDDEDTSETEEEYKQLNSRSGRGDEVVDNRGRGISAFLKKIFRREKK